MSKLLSLSSSARRFAGGRFGGRLAALALAAGVAAAALAIDVLPISLPRLIGLSELAVYGRVREVGETTFRFEVEEVLGGELSERQLEVRRYRPWPAGTPRPAPYAPGQAFVLFLVHEPGDDDEARWRILGAGGEGEMPVEGSWVYLDDPSIDFLERRGHRVHGAEVESRRFSRGCFLAAVREVRRCFRWRPPAAGGRPRPERVCEAAALAEYRLQSRLHEYLTDATLRQIPPPGP